MKGFVQDISSANFSHSHRFYILCMNVLNNIIQNNLIIIIIIINRIIIIIIGLLIILLMLALEIIR